VNRLGGLGGEQFRDREEIQVLLKVFDAEDIFVIESFQPVERPALGDGRNESEEFADVIASK
jgi:hypothetical protein